MDLSALLHPRLPDRASLDEFVDALADRAPEVEHLVADLRRAPADRTLIGSLFRSLHTIKGDAAMCRVDLGVMIAHPIETLLARLRSEELAFSDLFAELLLLALDRLELAVESLADGRRLDALKLPELVGGLELLGGVPREALDGQIARVIESVTGFRPSAASRLDLPPLAVPNDLAGDLAFFRELALKLEARSPLFAGRTARLLKLVLDTNAAAGTPVAARQLEAAVYMHDVGMMLLPEVVWLKIGRLSADEKTQMHAHPELAAGLLDRMPGWQDAARIVREHHEMPDGRGYPAGLADAAICPGAKILAIADAFEAVTLKQRHRGQSRSLLRAMAEINACDTQFAPPWIETFNQVIRRSLEA